VNIADYSALFGVIGYKYSYGNTPLTGKFFLPDLRGAFLKGVDAPMLFPSSTPITTVGGKQNGNVGNHAHTYKDRGSGNKVVIDSAAGSSTTVANNSDGFYWTDGYSYDSITQTQLDAETRPNCIGVNYIIKF
jgi:microcystin-dependent protein